jgi:fucose permease
VLSDEFPETAHRQLNFSQVFFSSGAVAGPFIVQKLLSGGAAPKALFLYAPRLALLFLHASVHPGLKTTGGKGPSRL